MNKRIEQLLYTIGLSVNYTGFRQVAVALGIAFREPASLRAVTKWLYPETARICGTNWRAVERNIRSMINLAWRTAPEKLKELSDGSLSKKPKPAQFLAILVHQLSESQ